MSSPAFALSAASVLRVAPTMSASPRRRASAARTAAGAGAAAALATLLAMTGAQLRVPPASAVVSQELCMAGEGAGCDAAAGDNPLIRELQERSKRNKTRNDEAVRERYWREGYGSYFSFGYNRALAKDPDTGKWSLKELDDPVSTAIRKSGVIPDMQQQ